MSLIKMHENYGNKRNENLECISDEIQDISQTMASRSITD